MSRSSLGKEGRRISTGREAKGQDVHRMISSYIPSCSYNKMKPGVNPCVVQTNNACVSSYGIRSLDLNNCNALACSDASEWAPADAEAASLPDDEAAPCERYNSRRVFQIACSSRASAPSNCNERSGCGSGRASWEEEEWVATWSSFLP